MIENLSLEMIGSYGFPIFMTLWLMLRTEKVISQNTEAIRELSVKVGVWNDGRKR